MISIQLINNDILDALKLAFPKGKTADLALNKYLRLLECELERGLHVKRLPFAVKSGIYRINLKALSQKGPRIGPEKKRLHKWLEENRMQLYSIITLGSNLTKELSYIKLKTYVEVKEFFIPDPDKEIVNSAVRRYHPEIDKVGSINHNDYHALEVDVHGIKNYVAERMVIPELTEKIKARLRLACDVLALAKKFNGFIYQRIRPSFFGRTYYGGISIQTVPKDLRWVMLGSCWEYDLKSAAATWKFGFVDAYIAKHNPGTKADKVFPGLLHHLQDKNDWMVQACKETFGVQYVTEDHKKLLKVALQAVGFGARKNANSWIEHRDDGGTEVKRSALVNVFKDDDNVRRFLNSNIISQYINDNDRLDNFIYKIELHNNPGIRSLKKLQTESGRISKSKVLAYLFQQQETKIMDKVRQMIAADGRTSVIANIHDCVITKHSLGELKNRIEAEIRLVWNNEYWTLGETGH